MYKWIFGTIASFVAYKVLDKLASRVGLGLVDDSGRKVKKGGDEFDRFFSSSDGKMITIKRNTSIEDTVFTMLDMIRQHANQTKELARYLVSNRILNRGNLRRIFNFVYNNIAYKLDSYSAEELRTPNRTWADRKRGVDCDCYSIFIGSILYNLGFPFVVRIADYGKGYQHVYIVVLGGDTGEIYLDPVARIFDKEVPYTKIKDYKL